MVLTIRYWTQLITENSSYLYWSKAQQCVLCYSLLVSFWQPWLSCKMRALVHLQAGMCKYRAAAMFRVSLTTIKCLQRIYCTCDTGDMKYRPKSDRPRVYCFRHILAHFVHTPVMFNGAYLRTRSTYCLADGLKLSGYEQRIQTYIKINYPTSIFKNI